MKRDITTKFVHAGERRPVPDGVPVSTPIYASATFTYDSMQEIDQVFAGEKQGFIYTRYGNPTTAALEEAVRERAFFDFAHRLFERGGCRIAVACVDEALLLTGKNLVDLLHRVVSKRCRSVDRCGDRKTVRQWASFAGVDELCCDIAFHEAILAADSRGLTQILIIQVAFAAVAQDRHDDRRLTQRRCHAPRGKHVGSGTRPNQ